MKKHDIINDVLQRTITRLRNVKTTKRDAQRTINEYVTQCDIIAQMNDNVDLNVDAHTFVVNMCENMRDDLNERFDIDIAQ